MEYTIQYSQVNNRHANIAERKFGTQQGTDITSPKIWTPEQVEWPRPIRSVPHVGSLKKPKHVVHNER